MWPFPSKTPVIEKASIQAENYIPTTSTTDPTDRSERYEERVKTLWGMYLGNIYNGQSLTKTIIDSRSSVIGGKGYDITSSNKTNQEYIEKFRKDIFKESFFVQCVKQAELEGKILFVPEIDSGKQKIKVLSIYRYEYKVVTDEYDYTEVKGINYRNLNKDSIDITPDKFVLGIFNGSIDDLNSTPSSSLSVIAYIQRVDLMMSRLWKINDRFSSPVLNHQGRDDNDTRNFTTLVKKLGGKLGFGQIVNTPGQMSYLETNGQSTESMKQEMAMNIKIISAATGLPVHWLGHIDLFGTRAGAQELAEFMEIRVRQERLIWQETLRELIIYCMKQDATVSNNVYDYNDIEVSIPISITSLMKMFADVYLDYFNEGVITKKTLREKIPDVDAETEEKREQETKDNERTNINSMLYNADGTEGFSRPDSINRIEENKAS